MLRFHGLLRGLLPLLLLTVTTSVPAFGQDFAKEKGLSAVLQPFVDSHSLAGAVVLVANGEKVLALESAGYADIETKTPMKTDAIFWIASQTKPITATGLMILVDEGKVKLDDPVEKYLPEFKGIQFEGKAPKNTMTVRHLLTHTSGMPFKSPEEQPTLDSLTLKECTASYAKTPLVSEPGTKYLYSNCGINAAGRIIEVVSEMPYQTFMDKRLFEPLGMKDTTFWPSVEQVKRLARPYKPNAAKNDLEATTIAQLHYPLSESKRQPMPGGGLFSTATDVGKFCQMILNKGKCDGKQIVSEASIAEMTRRQTQDPIKESYGLGWSVGGTQFGHGGALSTDMSIDTKRGLITVFLVQHAGFPGDGAKSKDAFKKAAEKFAAVK